MQNLIEDGKDEKIRVFDITQYLPLACGIRYRTGKSGYD